MTINGTVNRIRAFNRFYLSAMGLLGNHYLGSDYSVSEARILFEIYTNEGCNAASIAKAMNIDKSYLSRILKRHEKSGYLYRKISENDLRSFELYLTEKGKEKAKAFIEKSNQQIGEMIQPLNEHDCARLADALDTITSILSKKGQKNNEDYSV